MITDTHTHLYLEEYEEDRDDVIQRALNAGVGKMIFPNVDLSTIEPMKNLHRKYPAVTYMAMGLHPTEIDENFKNSLKTIENELFSNKNNYVAVGEIGIDLYWDKTFKCQQMEAFAYQIDWALNLDLPVIIHCREGLDEVLKVFKDSTMVPCGVFHSFGGNEQDVERIREIGDFYFGINGIVTFKNSKLRNTLPIIGLDRILLETDAPYLSPVPFRGKRNESSYIVNTVQTVADVFGISKDKIADLTFANAEKLFRLDKNS
ncbi:MAG: TatD family hydrolase [Muribaculaceae bacterium]|nr:TatD family hydrolase [Muribaculum sp.]MCM1295296.1 TatD family hydrolase [Muribaculaceae bacterium]